MTSRRRAGGRAKRTRSESNGGAVALFIAVIAIAAACYAINLVR